MKFLVKARREIVPRVLRYGLIALLIGLSLIALVFALSVNDNQQFVYLARAFLHGKLYFLTKPGNSWVDVVNVNGTHYWPLGPAPGLILTPFVWIFDKLGVVLLQGYLQLLLTAATFSLCYLLARKYKYSREDSVYLAFAFCFASPYIIVALLSWSWLFVQAVTVVFLCFALSEWHGKKRYWLIGMCYAVIFACRFTAGLTIVFYISDIWFPEKKVLVSSKLKDLGSLLFFPLISGIGLLWYNFARFSSPFDNGYMKSENMRESDSHLFEQQNYGLFQIQNIPMNSYYYFIKTFDPVNVDHFTENRQTYILKFPYITVKRPGISFFAASPVFLYIFNSLRNELRLRIVRLCLIPVIVVLPFLLTFYWPGMPQVGPRYMLDFLPFLYIILLHSFTKNRLSILAKTLILMSAVINYFIFIAIVYYS